MLQLVIYRNAHALTSQKCQLNLWEEKENECIANIFIICLDFCARWIPISDKFIHTPRSSYNEVMRLLEFAGMVNCG